MNNKEKATFKKPIYLISLVTLGLILIFSLIYGIRFGSVEISTSEVYEILVYKLFNLGEEKVLAIDQSKIDIIWLIRLPRILLATGVGIGLSLGGLTMQAIVKNPLADPYVLGVSSGASLGATLAIVMGVGKNLGNNYVGIAAFIGAFIISTLVILTSNLTGKSTSTRLLLSGMAFATLASSFSNFIVYFGKDIDGIRTVTFWLMGSLSGATWAQVKIILPTVLISMVFLMTQTRVLNLMLMGDEVSISLGRDLYKYRMAYLLIISLNVGLIVYASGVIGFVGLIVPHIVRIFFGPDHRKILPLVGLVGGIFLIWMDILSRIILKGVEIPIGILISIIGSPIFIYLMVSKNYGFGGGE